MARVLRQCDICKRYHASFLVDDPQLGKLRICKDCWKARYASPPAGSVAAKASQDEASQDVEPTETGAPAEPASSTRHGA